MRKNKSLPLILSVIGTILFNFLFWNESLGINLFIFTIFILSSTLFISGIKYNKLYLINGISLLVLSMAICLHASTFSIIMYVISFFLFTGTAHESGFQSQLYGSYGALLALLKIPVNIISNLPFLQAQKSKMTLLFRLIKIAIIPMLILLVFYVIFLNANPVFNSLSRQFEQKVLHILQPIFEAISLGRIIFILFGFSIIAWVLYKTDLYKVLMKESTNKNKIIRIREKKLTSENYPSNPYQKRNYLLSLGLKSEYQSAIILLVLVNILLFIVNFIDIRWVWFGFEYSETFDLKQFVHEGTYLLIISIILSIIIMLYFFRKNLNFYPKKKNLNWLSYLWILQNLILGISVVIRNSHYITYWGLAYKRIGVFIFLSAVAFGLITLFIKIKQKKSFYYLLRLNSLYLFLILVLSSLLNWDGIITNHNLNHQLEDHMETSFLLTMSDKVLPLIDQHKDILNQSTELNTYKYFSISYVEYYNQRVAGFIKKYEAQSWLSFNLAEWKAYQYYKK